MCISRIKIKLIAIILPGFIFLYKSVEGMNIDAHPDFSESEQTSQTSFIDLSQSYHHQTFQFVNTMSYQPVL